MKFLKSQRGDIEFLILAVVIIGAFVLVGGQYIFDTLPKSDTVTQNDTSGQNGSQDSSGSNNNSGNDTSTPGWKINLVSTTCDNGLKGGLVNTTIEGQQDGYIRVDVEKDGGLAQVFTHDFTAPSQAFQLQLLNKDGFDKNSWKLGLYSGGSSGSGGTLKSSKTQDPTGCK